MITSYNTFVPVLMGSGSSLRTGFKVRELGCKRVMVVSDKGLLEVGIAGTVVENIQNAGLEVIVYDGVVPDPPDSIINEAAEIARHEQVDGIVAVGGGSVIDTAKGVNVLINNEPPITNYLKGQKNLKPGLPAVFIPTTSGTGSEVTNMCVISATAVEKKLAIYNPVCLGTLAILDPELTLGLPPKITAETGADAFSHAVEAITSGHANPLSDALAREAIRLIGKWLPVAYQNGSNLEARENMMYASMIAGMAFTNALVHLGHSIGHALGAVYHVPHGAGCAAALPEVIEYTAKTESAKVKMICECLGVNIPSDASPEEIGATARQAIRKLFKSVNLPNLKEMGISLEDALSRILPQVSADPVLAVFPYKLSVAKITDIIKSAYDA